MKLDQRKLSMALVLVYIICVLFTTYTLFTLQDDLIYKQQALNISDLDLALPVFMQLYLAAGLTILFSLGLIYYFFNNKSMEIIYVEKKADVIEDADNEQTDESGNIKEFNIASLSELASNKVQSEDKLIGEGLNEICKNLEAGVGAFYVVRKDQDKKVLQMNATYAMSLAESQRPTYEFGEGLVGQVAVEQKPIKLDDIPEGYIKIISGLGSASPTHVLIIPVKFGNELCGVVEIASFTTFTEQHVKAVTDAFEIITNKLYGKAEKVKEEKKEANDESTQSKKGNKKA